MWLLKLNSHGYQLMNKSLWILSSGRGFANIHVINRSLIFVFFQTPLHFAAYNGKGDVVEILLRNGANINEKDVRNQGNEK